MVVVIKGVRVPLEVDHGCWLTWVWWVEGVGMSLVETQKLVFTRDVEVPM